MVKGTKFRAGIHRPKWSVGGTLARDMSKSKILNLGFGERLDPSDPSPYISAASTYWPITWLRFYWIRFLFPSIKHCQRFQFQESNRNCLPSSVKQTKTISKLDAPKAIENSRFVFDKKNGDWTSMTLNVVTTDYLIWSVGTRDYSDRKSESS